MTAASSSPATFWIVGTPLDDTAPLRPAAAERLIGCTVVVAESRARFERLCKKSGVSFAGKDIHFLDPRPDHPTIAEALRLAASRGSDAALLSDTGMPILFDPGSVVLADARKAGLTIRSVPEATSWGTACALCGWDAPFFVAGFPPRDEQEARDFLARAANSGAHVVLLERPYRYRALLDDAAQACGGTREAFVGWELGTAAEELQWGTLDQLRRGAEGKKGEFIVIVRGQKQGAPKGRRP